MTVQNRRAAIVMFVVAAAFGAITPVSAAVYIVPSDDELIRNASAIVHGRVVFTQSILIEDGTIVTDTTIEPIDVLKGDRHERFVVRDPGGQFGARAMGVSGWSGYRLGDQVLSFLEGDDGRLRTWGLSLGKFKLIRDASGKEVFLRGSGGDEIFGWSESGEPHSEQPRMVTGFLAYIRAVVAGRNPGERAYLESVSSDVPATREFRAEIHSHYPPSAFTQGTFRWARFDAGQSVTFRVSGSQPGYDSTGAAQRGMAAWTNEPNSNIVYQYGGPTTNGFVQDGVNVVVFNSSSDVPSGAIGYARWWADAEHTYKGERFWSISEGDAVMRSNLSISQRAFDEAVTHELGHTLGFRHSNEGTPASSQAVMNSIVSGNFGASLGSWDVDAATHVYTGTSISASTRGDFGGDLKTDILLRNPTSTEIWMYTMDGLRIAAGAHVNFVPQEWNVAGVIDFSGDRRSDILLFNTRTGALWMYLMNGPTIVSGAAVNSVTLDWEIAGVADFDGDGKGDILLRNRVTTQVWMYLMDGPRIRSGQHVNYLDPVWAIAALADTDGDGRADIVLRNASTGQIWLWRMNGAAIVAGGGHVNFLPTEWVIVGNGDLNGDRRSDLLLLNVTTGQVWVYLMNGVSINGAHVNYLPQQWTVKGTGDLNADGKSDIVLFNSATGQIWAYLMDGSTITAGGSINVVPLEWSVVGLGPRNQ